MIFDVIVGTTFEEFGNLRPFVAVLLVGFKHQFLLFGGPGVFVDGGVEVVMPSE